MAPRLYRALFYDFDMQEQWLFTVLDSTPRLPQSHHTTSAYHTRAVEAATIPAHKEITFN